MRYADGRRLEHRRMRVEDLVDLARADLDAGDGHHLLLAVDHAEVTVLVHADDVAGEEPAVAEDRGGLLRTFPVAVHEIRSAKTQLPRLARAYLAHAGLDVDDAALDIRQRNADRSRLADPFTWIRVRDRRRLGEAIALEDLA